MIETAFSWLGVSGWAEFWWVAFGLFGQLLFTARFLVQWLASERARRSVVPIAFWYFSIGGGLILLSYAIYRKDPVFILGQSMGVFIYMRNLWLIFAERRGG
ncbi:lipid-A-disaccharide synthase N-terminal domain-containing protein [Ostreiculturibacter nitratireducens]|uniref:lipid-A-disaccharide synthase N-terminal domain-containing protein n=1 Tax=Ostreiculturibacter nitratireducens TaxID=3075226 RepID=UPI0031B58E37